MRCSVVDMAYPRTEKCAFDWCPDAAVKIVGRREGVTSLYGVPWSGWFVTCGRHAELFCRKCSARLGAAGDLCKVCEKTAGGK